MVVFGILYCICGFLYMVGCCFEDKELRKNVANWLYKAEPIIQTKEVEVIKPVYVDAGARLQKLDCKMMVNEMDYYQFGNFAVANAVEKCADTLLQKVKSLVLIQKFKDYRYGGNVGIECSLKVVDPNQDESLRYIAANGIETHIGVPDFDHRKLQEEAFSQQQERFRRF